MCDTELYNCKVIEHCIFQINGGVEVQLHTFLASRTGFFNPEEITSLSTGCKSGHFGSEKNHELPGIETRSFVTFLDSEF